MTGHGNKKGMSLRKLAQISGDKTYHGKAHLCGNTLKRVDNKCCVACFGKTREAREATRVNKVDIFAMASRAFKNNKIGA